MCAGGPVNRLIRVLLVNDTPAVVATLQCRLGFEPDLRAVGKATRREKALSLALEVEPDVIVLDLGLPGTSDLSLAHVLSELRPQSAAVILASDPDLDRLQAALEGDHWALVSKYEPVEVLLSAIRATTDCAARVDP